MNDIKYNILPDHSLTVADHDLPCQIGVLPRNCNTVNYSRDLGKIRKEERFQLHFTTGLNPSSIFFLNQVHGDDIVVADKPCDSSELFFADADSIITDRRNLCLVIRTADCIPVFAVDPVRRCIGAAHSGWRSTEKRIVTKMIERMEKEYSSSRENLHLFILPGISSDSYTVNMDVASKFPGFFTDSDGKINLDLKGAIADDLKKFGVSGKNISVSSYCTLKDSDKFFSHRNGDAGRNLNYIYMV